MCNFSIQLAICAEELDLALATCVYVGFEFPRGGFKKDAAWSKVCYEKGHPEMDS
jgi:hypothetical protein